MRPYFTNTARLLVESMVASGNYDTLPILADCIEENGCEDHELLTAMRSHDEMLRGRVLERVVSGLSEWSKVRKAVTTLAKTAAKFHEPNEGYDDYTGQHKPIPHEVGTLSWLIDLLGQIVTDPDTYFLCGGYDTPVHGDDIKHMWKAYETLTGNLAPVLPNGYKPTPFSCSC